MHRKLGPTIGRLMLFSIKPNSSFAHAFDTFKAEWTNSFEEIGQLRLDLDFCKTRKF